MPGFSDDQNRWEQVLFYLNLLSMHQSTFYVPFVMRDGRVTRATVQRLHELARPWLPVSEPKETVHA